jgi:polysaccharide pyruvyl transferase WcaK-like protein
MKILHSYCLNYNIGDYYLGIGVKNLLRKHLEPALISQVNLQGNVFNEYFIQNVVNKKYDLLVIGGGGIIHGAHWPNGWFWLIEKHLIATIDIPFIVYGAGYNYFQDEQGIPEVGKDHLRETIQLSNFFSVRNDGSSKRLKEDIGRSVNVVPDPGFHINLRRDYGPPVISRETVVIQIANDKPEHRFKSHSGNTDSFIDSLREVVRYLSGKFNVILAPHVFDDIAISQHIASGFDNVSVWDFSLYAFDRCSESLSTYRDALFVIAMRGHGQIIPIAFNTPVIALSNHPKHRGLMENLGLNDYIVDVDSNNLRDQLIEKSDLLLSNFVHHRRMAPWANPNNHNQSKPLSCSNGCRASDLRPNWWMCAKRLSLRSLPSQVRCCTAP